MKHNGPGKFTLEQYFADELEENDAQKVREHLDICHECESYLKSLKENEKKFLKEHPFNQWAANNVKVSVIPWYQQFWDFIYKPVLLPAYGAVIICCIIFPLISIQNQNSEITFKGNELTFMYQRDGVVSPGKRSDLFADGDQIQVLYSYPKSHFVGMLSIDNEGTVSFYHPEKSSPIMTVESQGGNALSFPGSIILDNTKGSELIIILIAEKPMITNDVEIWANNLFSDSRTIGEMEKAAGKASLPNVIETRTLLLKKR